MSQWLGLEELWGTIKGEATAAARTQPELSSFFHSHVLKHQDLGAALAFGLAMRLASRHLPAIILHELIESVMQAKPAIVEAAGRDIQAYYERDAACVEYVSPLLYFKGFHALQGYRIAHQLWCDQRKLMALYIQSQMASVLDVDIHPAAQIGWGVFIDHATGVVIGETSIIEDDVSLLHGVTLGGSGCGVRHPHVEAGVTISAGAKLLGNIRIGHHTVIGAGSLVLESMPPNATVVGVPAKVVNKPKQA